MSTFVITAMSCRACNGTNFLFIPTTASALQQPWSKQTRTRTCLAPRQIGNNPVGASRPTIHLQMREIKLEASVISLKRHRCQILMSVSCVLILWGKWRHIWHEWLNLLHSVIIVLKFQLEETKDTHCEADACIRSVASGGKISLCYKFHGHNLYVFMPRVA